MSATIQAVGVGAGFGDRELFSGVDLVVAPGDLIGLVGPNGAGKSTLLRVLAGVRTPETGRVTVSPTDAQLGLLNQEPDRGEETIRAQLERRTGVAAALQEMDARTRPSWPTSAAAPGPTRATRTRSRPGCIWAAPTSTSASKRSPTGSA